MMMAHEILVTTLSLKLTKLDLTIRDLGLAWLRLWTCELVNSKYISTSTVTDEEAF